MYKNLHPLPFSVPWYFNRFLNLKIQEGEAHNIFCPAYECFQLVPVDIIESVVSKEMDKRYLQFDIKVWYLFIKPIFSFYKQSSVLFVFQKNAYINGNIN